jgi:hypothetical protein
MSLPRALSARGVQSGQTAVESTIIFVLFITLLAGLVEMTYLYRAKHTLGKATFDAARAGAVNHGLQGPMGSALARGMAPMYMRGSRDQAQVIVAVAEAEAVRAVIDGLARSVEIVSPTAEIFDELKVSQKLRLRTDDKDAPAALHEVIPNDNLNWRPRATVTATVDGELVDINVQDANLLKIRTYWCHRLLVPGVDRLIAGIAAEVNVAHAPAAQMACASLDGLSGVAGRGRQHILLSSRSTIRMQSPMVRSAFD